MAFDESQVRVSLLGGITAIVKKEILKQNTEQIPVINNLYCPEKCRHSFLSILFHLDHEFQTFLLLRFKGHDEVLLSKDVNGSSTDPHLFKHVRVSDEFVTHIFNDDGCCVDFRDQECKLVDFYLVDKFGKRYFFHVLKVGDVLTV